MGVWCLNQFFVFALEACVQSGLKSIMCNCLYISLYAGSSTKHCLSGLVDNL